MTGIITCKKAVPVLFFMIPLLLSSCSDFAFTTGVSTPDYFVPPERSNRPTKAATYTPDPPTATVILSSPTATLTLTPTPTWVSVAPGELRVPILLYHHVSDVTPTNRYYVPITTFQAQMGRLKDLGYVTISITKLVDVLTRGGLLPAHPLVISFDDGNSDIYENAFPIMKAMNFTGVEYIITDRLGSSGYLDADQLKEMAAAGWEIGSHSVTHVDLTRNHRIVLFEETKSQLVLEKAVGVPVNTFAYPYGLADKYIRESAEDNGYIAAVGLGTTNDQTWDKRYFLSRREVQGDYDMDQFTGLLTGTGDQGLTPTP
jgi:peptidoglycan/xylan/chitin deacetylase (PgdA/CDA1 family)